ncbi:hypothetical protein [Celeribacter baekdonensis]|uniref:hypothetical protein n=1 Tax=Celeribacter baekdonensis TaxID=875171 RepID=UPI00131F1E9B|nr:hypothetical protein [Celeribacter baekdonensis]
MSPIINRTRVFSSSLLIDFESEGFPTSIGPANGFQVLSTTWREILWAALTVGRPSISFIFQHRLASLFEALYRISQMRMALTQETFSQHLYRTNAFRQLDPTEKGAVSYALGMAFCKLFAHKLLNTHWLLHLDVFKDQLNPELRTGKSRPDLVGQNDAGDWHAFESKGRSSSPNDDAKQKAKQQAQRLVRVDGQDCRLHIGAISFFRSETLEFYWRDPAPIKEEPFEVRLPEDAWKHYYLPALSFSQSEGLDEPNGTDEIGISVEIAPHIYELLVQGQWSKAKELADRSRQELIEKGYFPDGIKLVVGESWAKGRGTFK